MSLSITLTLSVVVDGILGAAVISGSHSVERWVATGGIPGVCLDGWVEVTVLIFSWGVVSGLGWVALITISVWEGTAWHNDWHFALRSTIDLVQILKLNSRGNSSKGSDKNEFHIYY